MGRPRAAAPHSHVGAARPVRPAGRQRGGGAVPGERPLGLRHRRDDSGRRWYLRSGRLVPDGGRRMDQSTTATLTPRPGIWKQYVTDVRAEADAEASTTRATDRKMVIVFVAVALALTANNFLSDGTHPQWLESTLRFVGLGGLANRLHDAML